MTSNLRVLIFSNLIRNFLNYLIDQIIEINSQSIQIIQTEQKRSVDFYYEKVNDFKRNVQLNEL
jgi:uncharacterized protein (UPF0305 family)